MSYDAMHGYVCVRAYSFTKSPELSNRVHSLIYCLKWVVSAEEIF